jgi:hypothetical protein
MNKRSFYNWVIAILGGLVPKKRDLIQQFEQSILKSLQVFELKSSKMYK